MQRSLEYFDDFLEHPETYSDEEFLKIGLEFVEFLANNIGKYNITEEMAVSAEKKHRKFEESYYEEKEAKRQLEIASKKVEESAAAYDDAMAEIMEKGGKVIPVYTNLPKRRGSN